MDTKECVFYVEKWLRNGVNVVATGLDPRPRGVPFETTSPITRISRLCRKNKSNCTVCGKSMPKKLIE